MAAIHASLMMAVASSVVYGAADFLGGLAARRVATISVVVLSQLVGLLLALVVLPLLPPSVPTARDFAWGAASGLAGGIGVALLYHGLAIGTMSVVAPITAVCAVLIPVAVGILLGERPGLVAIAGIALAVVAIVLVSQSPDTRDAATARLAILVAVGSGVAIGIFLVLLQRTSAASGLWPLIVARAVSLTLFAAGAVVTRRSLMARGALSLILAGGALDMMANVLYLLAVRQGYLSLVATLTSLYPASTMLLARAILGERLGLIQQVGIASAVVAIVLIVRG